MYFPPSQCGSQLNTTSHLFLCYLAFKVFFSPKGDFHCLCAAPAPIGVILIVSGGTFAISYSGMNRISV